MGDQRLQAKWRNAVAVAAAALFSLGVVTRWHAMTAHRFRDILIMSLALALFGRALRVAPDRATGKGRVGIDAPDPVSLLVLGLPLAVLLLWNGVDSYMRLHTQLPQQTQTVPLLAPSTLARAASMTVALPRPDDRAITWEFS